VGAFPFFRKSLQPSRGSGLRSGPAAAGIFDAVPVAEGDGSPTIIKPNSWPAILLR